MAENKRLYWVDVARAIAVIFVYLGHYETERLNKLAFAFHLQLLFILAGFFAQSNQKYTPWEFFKRRFVAILVPYALWGWSSIVTMGTNSAGSFGMETLKTMLNPTAIRSNLWFFPTMMSVSIVYYLLLRGNGNKTIWLILALAFFLLFGQDGVAPANLNPFALLLRIPGVGLLNSWFSIGGIAQYLFWYALGASAFEWVKKFVASRETNPMVFHLIGVGMTGVTCILYLKRIREFNSLRFIFENTLLNNLWSVFAAICICICVLYFSVFLEESKYLRRMGELTTIFVGLEFIMKRVVTQIWMPLLGMGEPTLDNTWNVVSIVFLVLAINYVIAERLDQYFPILNGNRGNRAAHTSEKA